MHKITENFRDASNLSCSTCVEINIVTLISKEPHIKLEKKKEEKNVRRETGGKEKANPEKKGGGKER